MQRRTIGILAVAALSLAAVGCNPNKVPPPDAARIFSRDLGLKVVGVSCAGTDTDNDGYVSCSVNVDDGDGRGHLESLQCAALGADNVGGCKQTIAKAVPTSATVIR